MSSKPPPRPFMRSTKPPFFNLPAGVFLPPSLRPLRALIVEGGRAGTASSVHHRRRSEPCAPLQPLFRFGGVKIGVRPVD